MSLRSWTRALMIAGLAASLARAAVQAELSSSHEATGEEMSQIRGYSDRVGRELLKEELGLDLDALAVELDPSHWAFHRPKASEAAEAAPGLSPGPAPGIESFLRLRLEQSDDLRRLQQGLNELPFGLSVDAQLPFLADMVVLQTKLWVPFSWHEEIRAQALLPFHDLGRKLTLRSDYRTQLGLNKLEAGLGTSVVSDSLGPWDVDYDFQRNFGQGENEAIHWLKFSRSF
jgi:hypothetical protein